MPSSPRPLVILGPTAGGKSDLAVALSEALPKLTGFRGGEVLGADSMQVYRHLDAGTAKPPGPLRQRVPHHLIDLVEPTERFTVRDWLNHAEQTLADCQARGVHPIVVGGTNLYLKALLEGFMDGPDHDPQLRADFAKRTPQELHAQLQQVDPDAAERIAPNDRQRLTRALEVFALTGEPISAMQAQWQDQPPNTYRHDPILIGLQWRAEAINPRINLRVKAMFKPDTVEPELAAETCINGESLPDEVLRLDDAHQLGPQAREALGYKQCLATLRPEKYPDLADAKLETLEDAMERTKVLTRRFAKQQRTWLKRFANVHWIDMPRDRPTEQAIEAVQAAIH
ncbi:MAG: tRNA (adenosine(37)-N6)-dimethylallyltransferase MiaA [Planctomycetota bacterium]